MEEEFELEKEEPSSPPVIEENGPSASNNANVVQRKKQFRWNYAKDLTLVKEVENCLPFCTVGTAKKEAWTKIAQVVEEIYKTKVSTVGAQRRFELLLQDFKKEDLKDRYKSGTEEEVTELKEKLGNLVLLVDDCSAEKLKVSEQKQKQSEDEKKAADEIRGAALKTLETKESPKSSKRSSDSELIALWKESQEDEKKQKADVQVLKVRKLDLMEKQLELEKEKLDHQKIKDDQDMKLQADRFELEREERLAACNTNKALLELVLKKMQ